MKQKKKYHYRVFTTSEPVYCILKNLSNKMSKELGYYVSINSIVGALVMNVNARQPEVFDRLKVEFREIREKRMYDMFVKNHKTKYSPRGD